jgi:subfamily B ATP-binding cassette protein MsbA
MARVLLQDTDILVFDEPTSALDSESEGYIQQTLHELHGKKTLIVIAHRLATVVAADQLLVVEDGRIVERGTHAELMSQNGAYKNLFQSQLIGVQDYSHETSDSPKDR